MANMRQVQFDSLRSRSHRVLVSSLMLMLSIHWAAPRSVLAQESTDLENHAQFYMMCAGYLYGVAVAASRQDDEDILEMSTLLTNTAFVLARDSGETEEELRAIMQEGMQAGLKTPTTDADWAGMQRTVEICSEAARSIRDQLDQ